ncbi:MAG: hypothetical protein NTY53_08375 [Kiritimatiellaeota bacterium]|nr:hypothetical protein [Kiritimatiellota bacterium]
MEHFEQGGQVEVLRPVGRAPGTLPNLDYWRWCTAEDHRYRWQVALQHPANLALRDLRRAWQEAD